MVVREADAFGAGFIEAGEQLRVLTPHRPASEFEMRNMRGQFSLLSDGADLIDGVEDISALAAHMACVNTAVGG
ncbi:MAG TPA: hypothetical protein EYQ62_00095, partial [Verrucomicrobiales bacterium]|nr:hypothetical protein [Verrucomicrobiales bacterium]